MGQKNLFKDIMGNKGIGKQGCIAGSMGYPGLPQGQRERVRQIGAGGRWGGVVEDGQMCKIIVITGFGAQQNWNCQCSLINECRNKVSQIVYKTYQPEGIFEES